jgi:MFS family permease
MKEDTTPVENRAPKWRHLAAATVGNALEYYDFMIYSFFAIQIGHVFFSSQSAYGSLMLSLATFGAGFITRPIGGIVLGFYADRAGRRAAMMLCYVMMGGSIAMMALIPSYAAIGIAAPALAILTRLVQGFSVGGAVGPNAAYLLEVAPARRRGLAVSWQAASQFLASTLGGVVGVALTSFMAPSTLETYGWRIAFGLGALTLPFGVWLQRGIPETLHRADPASSAGPKDESVRQAVRRSLRVIILGLVILSVGPIVAFALYYLTTFAQSTLHLSPRRSFALSAVGNVCSAVAILAGGWLSDRIGRRPVMIWSNLAHLLLLYPTALWMVQARSNTAILAYLAVGCIGMMPFGVFSAALSESLPKNIRGAGFSTIYAISVATFGGTCQLVITWLIHVTGSPMAPTWYLTAALLVGQLAFMVFPESAPVRTHSKTTLQTIEVEPVM